VIQCLRGLTLVSVVKLQPHPIIITKLILYYDRFNVRLYCYPKSQIDELKDIKEELQELVELRQLGTISSTNI